MTNQEHGWTGEQVKVHLESEVRAVEEQLDRRIGTLKELMITLFEEKDRALKMADDEREKAANALRGEQQRAIDHADTEREKAAQILREALVQQIQTGDAALQQHIEDQIAQVGILIDSYTRLAGVQHEASEKAILKAENAAEKRFESVNEFRAQLAAQTASFLPRETFDVFNSQTADWKSGVEERLNQSAGKGLGINSTVAWAFSGVFALAAVVTLILSLNG